MHASLRMRPEFVVSKRVATWWFLLNCCLCLCPFASHLCCCHNVTHSGDELKNGAGRQLLCDGTSVELSGDTGPHRNGRLYAPQAVDHESGGTLSNVISLWMMGPEEESPLSSSAAGPWDHSLYSSFSHISKLLHLRSRRSTVTRYSPGVSLPQSLKSPSTFGVKFLKCAQVKLNTDPPQLTFFLRIHNMGPASGTNLSQVAVRDSISGIVPLKTAGKVVERGYQTFTIDSLSAGSQIVVQYTAHVRSHKSEILELPAFLTFSNASQNDVSMFGPLTTNLTLRVNSTNRIYPNHGVHFAGFVAGFFVTLLLLLLVFLAFNLIGLRTRINLLHQRRIRRDSDFEYADCNLSETVKDEAAFEDKMVDIMVLEDPQNMYKALENLEMSTRLHATNSLEAMRIQLYKDITSALLGGLRSQGQASGQSQQRLLSVLHGQLLGMEGRLKEERGARMAALAARCNLETRKEMEAEHHREAAEKAQAELMCQHADQQELLQCSVLLEKLHKLRQNQLQHSLLVRHEEASAQVQRQIIVWRRVELHKIFSEELEEATRMGELEKSTAKSLQHRYFTYQDQLEEVLDVVLANQRYVIAERSAQRKFLLHSLHSLNSLISDTFSSTSSNLDIWFSHMKGGSSVPAEQLEQLQEKAQKELVCVRQRLDESLNQERRAMRCGLIKKRRELISDLVRVHKQKQRELSSLSKALEDQRAITEHLHSWQNLLTAHSSELAELINNLDEEAAADIRKMTMHVIQSSMTDIKAILPTASQSLLALQPRAGHCSALEEESVAGSGQNPGQGVSVMLQGQERLHQEGKAALHTLSCTREVLRKETDKELQEQKELRTQCREFFRSLCLSQLALSEDDELRMKLEFQKCFSVKDHCLVLPHAVCRRKLHRALEGWREEREKHMNNMMLKRKTSGSREKSGSSDLLLLKRRLKEKIGLFEKEKEMESELMNKVLEETQREREDDLCCQADSLAMQMAMIHYQKAERWIKVVETLRAMLTLHSLLVQLLRERKVLDTSHMAQTIQSYCLGLEEAEQQLQKERKELDGLLTSQLRAECRKTQQRASGEEEEDSKDEDVFQLQPDCRMTTILQEALYKREQVIALLAGRFQVMSTNNQAMKDLREQTELKRLYATCDQDLEFASRLVKQSQLSAEVLLETLRLLLPTLPESELLSITDALCPKPHSDTEHHGCSEDLDTVLLLKLRKDVVERNMPSIPSCFARRQSIQEKRESLMEKLFPKSHLFSGADDAPLLVEGNGNADSFTKTKQSIYEPTLPGKPQQSHSTKQKGTDTLQEVHQSTAAADHVTSASSCSALGSFATGERLFVFRDPPESRDPADVSKRRKKRNFLNLKKSSVAPANLP
ncbi:limbin-like isoform X2 [Gouania willdenowi]|uniref:Limbin n=1 Tax=Gouania willdenowi TaxID=441366 RepID=A0A8C5EA95_GOUWI|nr:limbin isoform X2 [Gouania willdenowi]